jgi:hypothetical protein
LSAGLALRRSAQRYQFVCPAAWGDQFATPMAALPDGTIVVGASSGLMLVGEDGSLRAHPDLAAVGGTREVVRSQQGVFSLRSTSDGSEVLAIDGQTLRVLWKDQQAFTALAAFDDKLALLRERTRTLEQVIIAAVDGAVVERQTTVVDLPVDYVFARADAGSAYALFMLRDASLALGSLRMNQFTRLVEAQRSIAGPLSVAGVTLIALDGQLSELTDGRVMPLADDHEVVCLGQQDGLTYACDRDGISLVSGRTLGEPVFLFSWLIAPELERVAAGEARMRCNAQWHDLRADLQLAGVSLLEDSSLGSPGAPPVGAAVGGAAGADASLSAAGSAAQASAAGAVGPQPERGASGCRALPGRAGSLSQSSCALAVASVCAFRRLRRRRPDPVRD